MNINKARNILIPSQLEKMDLFPFVSLKNNVPTMSTPLFLATMNKLASCLENNEIYMEIGSYRGGSLIGALLNNNTHAICIENFSQFVDRGFSNNLDTLSNNLMRFGVANRIRLHVMDFHDYFKITDEPEIGLYYYDGEHNMQNTIDALELALPYIVEHGIIVLDDTIVPEVTVAVNDFIGRHAEEIKIIFSVSPSDFNHSEWWNGTLFLEKINV
jgi:predicted O-methyltransferase YrrM